MICTTKAYQGVWYEGTKTRIVRVIQIVGENYILGDSMSFIWGLRGFGERLAFAILSDAFGKKMAANNWHDFQDNVIDLLPKTGWILIKEDLMQRYDAEVTLMAMASIGERKK
jgi:hypothetical protein